MDIVEVTTRYLAESDRDLDDSQFAHYGTNSFLIYSLVFMFLLLFFFLINNDSLVVNE
jgi:hypothetical protein